MANREPGAGIAGEAATGAIAPITAMPLGGRKVLVVEDECLIADDLAAALREDGAEVIGPAPSLPMALRLAGHNQLIDAALVNIDLQGVAVFPLVDVLRTRSVPMIFLTGYGDDNIPPGYSDILCCRKPIAALHVLRELETLLRRVEA